MNAQSMCQGLQWETSATPTYPRPKQHKTPRRCPYWYTPLIQSYRMPNIRHKTPVGGDHPSDFGAHGAAMPISYIHQNYLLCQRIPSPSKYKFLEDTSSNTLAWSPKQLPHQRTHNVGNSLLRDIPACERMHGTNHWLHGFGLSVA